MNSVTLTRETWIKLSGKLKISSAHAQKMPMANVSWQEDGLLKPWNGTMDSLYQLLNLAEKESMKKDREEDLNLIHRVLSNWLEKELFSTVKALSGTMMKAYRTEETNLCLTTWGLLKLCLTYSWTLIYTTMIKTIIDLLLSNRLMKASEVVITPTQSLTLSSSRSESTPAKAKRNPWRCWNGPMCSSSINKESKE